MLGSQDRETILVLMDPLRHQGQREVAMSNAGADLIEVLSSDHLEETFRKYIARRTITQPTDQNSYRSFEREFGLKDMTYGLGKAVEYEGGLHAKLQLAAGAGKKN